MIWQELKKLEGKRLATLAHGKEFEVREVSEEQVTIYLASSKKLRAIHRSELEGPYNDLWLSRRISLSHIRTMHSEANPTYVAALLANSPDIQFSLNPIKLWMER